MKITIVSFVMTAAFGLIACDNTKHNTLTEQEKAMPADTSSPTRLMRILSFRGTGKSRKEEIAVYYIMW